VTAVVTVLIAQFEDNFDAAIWTAWAWVLHTSNMTNWSLLAVQLPVHSHCASGNCAIPSRTPSALPVGTVTVTVQSDNLEAIRETGRKL